MRWRIGVLSLLVIASPVLADNWIDVIGGTEGVDYVRYQYNKRVKIMTPGAYCVRATNGPAQLGDIDRIYVESASGGSVAGTRS